MKRLFAFAVVCIICIGLLTACDGGEAPVIGNLERRERTERPENNAGSDDLVVPVYEPEPEHEEPETSPSLIFIRGRFYSTSLEELDLAEMGLTDEDIKPLAYMMNLTYLDLWDNLISDISPLAGLVNLELLDLDENQIEDISPLAELTNLIELHLWDNLISDISPLAGLVNLEILDLYENHVEDLSPLAKLTNLTYLWLDYNNITDLSPLYGLHNLRELDVSENPLTAEQIESLRSALPNCKVIFDNQGELP